MDPFTGLVIVVITIVVLSALLILITKFYRSKARSVDTFVDDACLSIIATSFGETQMDITAKLPDPTGIIKLPDPTGIKTQLPDPVDRNSRLSDVPASYARPQSVPSAFTDWYASRQPNVKMTQVPAGDFVALLYGPTASPPSNIGDYASYFDYVIWTLYTNALGLKLAKPQLKVTAYLTDSGQVAPPDVTNAVAYGGTGWNLMIMSMPTQQSISVNPEIWQEVIGHELFHVFSTFANQNYLVANGIKESLANFFGWLSVSMYNGKRGADLLTHGMFSCYQHFHMPMDITFMCGSYAYDLNGLESATYWMYGAWHIWWFWYKEYGIDSLLSFLNRSDKTGPIIYCTYLGNDPSGSLDFVPSSNAGQPCPEASINAATSGNPTCKTGLLRDVDMYLVDLHDFISTFVARTITNAYFTDDFVNHYTMSTATSGNLYWGGFVVMYLTTSVNVALSPNAVDWRIVLSEYDGQKWSTTIYPGDTGTIAPTMQSPSKKARLALVAAYDHPMLPGVTPSWSISLDHS